MPETQERYFPIVRSGGEPPSEARRESGGEQTEGVCNGTFYQSA